MTIYYIKYGVLLMFPSLIKSIISHGVSCLAIFMINSRVDYHETH